MRVAAHGIDVHEIRHAELAKANFQPSPREFVKQRERVAVVFDFVLAEGKNVMDHTPPEVRSFAQERIAYDVQIRISGQPKALAERGATRLFDIDQQFGRIVQSRPGVKRQHARRRLLVIRAQTVCATIGRGKWRKGLKDKIRLSGKPVAGVFEVREHRLRARHRQARSRARRLRQERLPKARRAVSGRRSPQAQECPSSGPLPERRHKPERALHS